VNIVNTPQKVTIAAVVLAAAVIVSIQSRRLSALRAEMEALKAQQQQQAELNEQIQTLRKERDRATNALAAISGEKELAKKGPNEVLKLRGEVGRLQQEKSELGSSSALSKVTANPEASKMLRDQQKLGMGMIYKGFSQRAKLTPEQTGKLNDLLADDVMENVAHVTTALRDKPTPEQLNQMFATQEAALRDKVQELLGPDTLNQFQDYTKNLTSTLTAEQFKDQLTGDDQAKEAKAKQLEQLMREQIQTALAGAGLPADYQTVPILNFRNIASEQSGDQSLKLLEGVFGQVGSQASAFLSPEELTKFKDFTNLALKNNRAALSLNRTMMAPLGN
jgi:hypothetical protein